MTRRALAWLGIALALGYLTSLALITSWQDALVFPGAYMTLPTPTAQEAAAMGWQVHVLDRDEEPPLHLWHHPADPDVPPRGVILMMPGNAGHPLQFRPHAELAAPRGWHVVSVVYRGFSGAAGHPSQEGVVADADGAWRWATQTLDLPVERVVIHGHSLGGGVAAQLAARHPPPLLVLASSFDSLRAMVQHRYPFFPVDLTLRHPFDTRAALDGFGGHLLLLHAEDDPAVPIDAMRRLAAVHPEATVVVSPTGGHRPPVAASPAARQAWLDALDAVP